MRDPDYDKLSEIVFQVLFESGINELPINMVGLCQSRGIKIKYLPDEEIEYSSEQYRQSYLSHQ